MKQKSIELLAFDRNHELQYEGKCKLRIDKLSKMLLVEPVNEEYKMITAMFKCNFVMDKNILFVFGEHELSDFALIFDEEKRCKKVYDFICKDKAQNIVGKKMLCQRFVLPISNKIAQNDNSAVKLKKLMIKWINIHERKAKEEYLIFFKENNLFKNLSLLKIESENNVRKRRRPRNESIAEYYGDKKELQPASKKRKISSLILLKDFPKTIDQSQFKFVNVKCTSSKLRWRLQRKLLIFVNSEKTVCHEFSCSIKMNLFTCIGCKAKGKYISAISDKDENGFDCIKIEDEKHVCAPIPYTPENYIEMKIYKQPEYEILENCNTASGKILIIFDENDKSQCWEFLPYKSKISFVCRQCFTLAKLWNENTEDECVELTNAEHKCKFVPYEPKKFYQFNEFVVPPDFEVQTVFKKSKQRKELIIFDKNDKKMCYVYSDYQNYFHCTGCRRKGLLVSAKLLQNSDGVDYVLLSTTKHICELQSYSNIKKEVLIQTPDFELMENTETGVKKLFIFDSNDRYLCYTFSHRTGSDNCYYCLGCYNKRFIQRLNKLKRTDGMIAKLRKDVNGEDIVRLNGSKHICKPKKYEPKKFATKENEKCYDYFFYRRKAFPTSINVAIYHPEERDMCYQFNYKDVYSYFKCNGCQYKEKSFSVRIQKDDNGVEYFSHDYKKHICQPIKVSSIHGPAFLVLNREKINLEKKKRCYHKQVIMEKNKSECEPIKNANAKVISSSDFITVSENSDGKITAVIVFTSPARGECYEFGFQKNKNLFRCRGCKLLNKFTWVKLWKKENGQEYLQQSLQDHICQPRKYVKEKYEPKNIISSELFEFHPNTKGEANKRLVVFTSTAKDFVYEFYEKREGSYKCLACSRLKHFMSLKLHKHQNGNNFLEYGTKQHACQPRKYDPKKFIYCEPNDRKSIELGKNEHVCGQRNMIRKI